MRLTKRAVAPAVAVVVLGVLPLLAGSAVNAAPQTMTFSNPTALTIPAPGQVPPPWKANPYPSPITVSGMSGTVSDIDVTLGDIDCSATNSQGTGQGVYPDDMDVLLVGPTPATGTTLPGTQSGADTMLISDVWGDYNASVPLSNVTVTLSDQAASLVPINGSPASGTFKPTDDDSDLDELTVDTFSNAGLNGVNVFSGPTPSGNTSLAIYNGTDPNGTWSVYFVDDVAGFENCAINGGWSLTITTTGPTTTTTTAPTTTTTGPTTTAGPTTTTTAPTTTTTAGPTTTTAGPTTTTAAETTTTTNPPTDADLRLAKTGPAKATVGRRAAYVVTAKNLGPGTATSVTITDTLPAEFTVSKISSQRGVICSQTGSVVTCTTSTMAAGRRTMVRIIGAYATAGTYTNVASVVTGSADPGSDNNSASVTTAVSAG